MENQGYIKIHRKILDNPISKKPEYCWLWIYILMKSNHKETSIIFNNKKENIKIGEFITGRKQLSLETGINESKIERILKYLENEQQIEQQKNNKFRRIIVKNYILYQQSEQQNEQQMNNKRTTSEQPVNTNKNDKNDKNEKNIIQQTEVCGKQVNDLIELFKNVNLTYEKLFSNKTERKVLETFIKKWGYEKTYNGIKWGIENQDKFTAITKPTEFDRNINKILLKNKDNKPTIKNYD